MLSVKIVVWQEAEMWIGYLLEYSDYWTQGETIEELYDHLKDLYRELNGGQIPGARRVQDLVIS